MRLDGKNTLDHSWLTRAVKTILGVTKKNVYFLHTKMKRTV